MVAAVRPSLPWDSGSCRRSCSPRRPLAAVLDFQADVEALDVDVLQRHAGDALRRRCRCPLKSLGSPWVGADHPGPAAVDGDVRGLDDDRAVGLRRIEHGVGGDLQRRRTARRRGLGPRDGGRDAHGAQRADDPRPRNRDTRPAASRRLGKHGKTLRGGAVRRQDEPPAVRYKGGKWGRTLPHDNTPLQRRQAPGGRERRRAEGRGGKAAARWRFRTNPRSFRPPPPW